MSTRFPAGPTIPNRLSGMLATTPVLPAGPLLVLGALTFCAPGCASAQAVLIDPGLALPVERVFTALDTELVFCLDAEPGPLRSWQVTAVRLARQGTAGDRDTAAFECDDAEGFMHNHPRSGVEWCKLSRQDRKALRQYSFAVLWCPSRRFTYEVRSPPPRSAREIPLPPPTARSPTGSAPFPRQRCTRRPVMVPGTTCSPAGVRYVAVLLGPRLGPAAPGERNEDQQGGAVAHDSSGMGVGSGCCGSAYPTPAPIAERKTYSSTGACWPT